MSLSLPASFCLRLGLYPASIASPFVAVPVPAERARGAPYKYLFVPSSAPRGRAVVTSGPVLHRRDADAAEEGRRGGARLGEPVVVGRHIACGTQPGPGIVRHRLRVRRAVILRQSSKSLRPVDLDPDPVVYGAGPIARGATGGGQRSAAGNRDRGQPWYWTCHRRGAVEAWYDIYLEICARVNNELCR